MNGNMIHLAASQHQVELRRAANAQRPCIERAATASTRRGRLWRSLWPQLSRPAATTI
jgi:hypothetical protein